MPVITDGKLRHAACFGLHSSILPTSIRPAQGGAGEDGTRPPSQVTLIPLRVNLAKHCCRASTPAAVRDLSLT